MRSRALHQEFRERRFTRLNEASSEASARLTVREIAFAFAIYIVATAIAFLPAALNLGKTIIGSGGDGDNYLTVWELWWFRHAVLSGQDPAYTSNVFALLGTPVPFIPENFFTEAVALPLQSFMSALAAYNFLVLSSFALSGVTAYILASEFVSNRLARFAAGFIYAFSTFHFFRAAGHLGEVTMEWMPFLAWAILVFVRRPTLYNAVLTAIGVALVPLSEVYYGAYFVLPFSIAIVVYMALTNRRWFSLRNTSLIISAYLVGGVLAYIPVRSLFHLDAATKAVTASYASSSLVPLSANLSAFFLPDSYNPIFGKATFGIYSTMGISFPIEQAVFLGYTALALSIVAVVYATRRSAPRITWFWLGLSLLGILLALGPELHVGGHRWFPLPLYNAVFGWSALSNFRAPNRLVVVPLLGIAMLAAIGLDRLITSLRWTASHKTLTRFLVVTLLAAYFAETCIFSFPYPAVPIAVPSVYKEIGSDPADTILLDLPILPSGYFQMMQIFHGKRLVNGYTSRMTPDMTNSVLSVPSVPYFVPSFETGINLPGPRQFDTVPKMSIRDAFVSRNIHYIVFHKIVDHDSIAWSEAFFKKNIGPPMADNESLTVWHF